MIGKAVLAVAGLPAVAGFVHDSSLMRGLVHRFVAGETLDDAIEATRALNDAGIRATLAHLGENTTTAEAAHDEAVACGKTLEAIHASEVEANLSLKLTALGLDLSEEVCQRELEYVLARAQELGIFVRVDMESSGYTTRTLQMVRHQHRVYPHVGAVLQADLYRTRDDLESLLDERIRVRLTKGAYAEPPEVAYPRKRDTDRNYERLMEQLLREGDYPALATHDERLIEHAQSYARRKNIPKSHFEFQMLYGVRRALQEDLVRQGYNVRAYVPYGTQWYPYLTRRLAERPANVAFAIFNLRRA